MHSSEGKLYVVRALEGDKQAFNLLVNFYYDHCLQKARAIVGHETLDQDLTQISLLQAYHCLDKLKDPPRFKFWLLGIVRNISYNFLKEKSVFFP